MDCRFSSTSGFTKWPGFAAGYIQACFFNSIQAFVLNATRVTPHCPKYANFLYRNMQPVRLSTCLLLTYTNTYTLKENSYIVAILVTRIRDLVLLQYKFFACWCKERWFERWFTLDKKTVKQNVVLACHYQTLNHLPITKKLQLWPPFALHLKDTKQHFPLAY